jgi:hypothetical protein
MGPGPENVAADASAAQGTRGLWRASWLRIVDAWSEAIAPYYGQSLVEPRCRTVRRI